MKRRNFLTSTTAALGFVGLQNYLHAESPSRVVAPYGPLVPDPNNVLDLPEGFTYQIISRTGDPMSDGLKVPGKPDGMACFEGKNGNLVLICNHELGTNDQAVSPFPTDKAPKDFDKDKAYDLGKSTQPPYLGGTSNIVYDPLRGEVLSQFLSLIGTDRNCAGGTTPWGTWITCEEPVDLTSRRGKEHGYCFEVKATEDGKLQEAIPLKQLGRFRHEAVAVDPETGIIYITEDISDGLLYRFVPDKKEDLTRGELQALMVISEESLDLRNYAGSKSTINEGQKMEVTWITMDRVDAPKNDLRIRGFKNGAARFARGEGIQYADGSFYICCTDGGPGKQGQIYKLTPSQAATGNDVLELYLQPAESDLLTNGDNICAAPWGDLVICEDLIAQHKQKTPHIRGINKEGQIYDIARNAQNKSEFAGSCFSPDGSILFVNMQMAGLTFAIRGPWQA